MSLFTQWVPHEWSDEPHREELESYADRVIDGYTELAPNFKSAILHRQVIGPHDMEQELGMIGGNIFHGELSADQLFHMRPAPGYADYRTPIRGALPGIVGDACRRRRVRDPGIQLHARDPEGPQTGSVPPLQKRELGRAVSTRCSRPRSVAVVGARRAPGSNGNTMVRQLIGGRVHRRSRRGESEVRGGRGYRVLPEPGRRAGRGGHGDPRRAERRPRGAAHPVAERSIASGGHLRQRIRGDPADTSLIDRLKEIAARQRHNDLRWQLHGVHQLWTNGSGRWRSRNRRTCEPGGRSRG